VNELPEPDIKVTIQRQIELLKELNDQLASPLLLENVEQIRKNAETIAQLSTFL
jgi:hypothetical protein